jgi:hypothetical protein
MIKNWTAAFPGIGVRVKSGLIAIPPSAGREWIKSFDVVPFKSYLFGSES